MTRRRWTESIIVSAIVFICTVILIYQFCLSRPFLYQRIHLLLASGRYEEALPLYEKFMKKYSGDKYIYQRLRLSFAAGEYEEAVKLYKVFLEKHSTGEYVREAREELRENENIWQRDAVVLKSLQEQCKGINVRDTDLNSLAGKICEMAKVNVVIHAGLIRFPPDSPPKINLDTESPISFETILDKAAKQLDIIWLIRNQAVIIADPDAIPSIERSNISRASVREEDRERMAKLKKESRLTLPNTGGLTTIEDIRSLIAPLAEVNMFIDPDSQSSMGLPLADSPFALHIVNPGATFENILSNAAAPLNADWTVRYHAVIIAKPKMIKAIEKLPRRKKRPADSDDAMVWERLRKESGITYPGGDTTLEDIRALISPLCEASILIDPSSEALNGLPLADSPFIFNIVTPDLTFGDVLNNATALLKADWTIRNKSVIIATPDRLASIEKRPLHREPPRREEDREVWEELQAESGITFPGKEITLKDITALIASVSKTEILIDLRSYVSDELPLFDKPFAFNIVTPNLSFEDILNNATALLGADWTIREQTVIIARKDRGAVPKGDIERDYHLTEKLEPDDLAKAGKAVVSPLIFALKYGDSRAQTKAAYALGEIKYRRAVKPLTVLLRDENLVVRETAAAALKKITGRDYGPKPSGKQGKTEKKQSGVLDEKGPAAMIRKYLYEQGKALYEQAKYDEAIPRYAEFLQTYKEGDYVEEARRELFCKILPDATIGLKTIDASVTSGAVVSLIGFLKDKDEYVRMWAAWTLGEIGDVRAVPPLIAALEDWHYGVKYSAKEALGKTGIQAIEPIILALEHENKDVRRNAALALGEIGDPRAVAPLITRLSDSPITRPDKRWFASQALGKIGDPRAVGPLIAALKDKDPFPRLTMALARGWIGEPEAAVDPLARASIAWALGEIGDSRAVDPLIAALEHVLPDVQATAAEALGKIGDLRAVDPLTAALKNSDAKARAFAGAALHRLGYEPGKRMEELVAALKDNDCFVRLTAVDGLGIMKDPRAVDPLIAALRDDDGEVRTHASQVLGKIGDPRAVGPLIAALKDGDRNVRCCTVKALGKIKDFRAVMPLIPLLKDKDRFTRERSAEALDAITGNNFGRDPARWQQWWDQNQGTLKPKNIQQ